MQRPTQPSTSPTQPVQQPTQPSTSPMQPVPQQKQRPVPQPAPEPSRFSARHRVPRRAPSRYAVIAFALVVASLTAGSAAFGLAVRSQSRVIGLGADSQGSINQAARPGSGPGTSGAAPTTAATPRASAPSATPPGAAPTTAAPRTSAPGSAPSGAAELTTAAVPPTSSLPAAEPLSPQELAVLNTTNAARANVGCAPLRIDSRLQAAAGAHAVDMVDKHYFSHVSPDGLDASERAEAAGFPSGAGENIAMGYPTASAVMAGWMASTGHRANILNCSYTVIGVGYDPGTIRAGFAPGSWVQMFGVL